MFKPSRLITSLLSAVVFMTACSDGEQSPNSSSTNRESITDPATKDGEPQNMEEEGDVDPDLQIEESDEQIMGDEDDGMQNGSVEQEEDTE
ncbi:hypothetical protein [Alkalicoccobacillus porphyridii]|uniref:Secreted protein n=1 Tax=Alkalicoccobacillus porphyridii TaxID=2597270 RepID=A0A554A4H4_9BACI|nr:hypothetical protein [Alkalicoccobacillus porphyridii]TSB48582.1 hypothetical protein FN960_03245 [Alkalicoccobacillus porphyridii]